MVNNVKAVRIKTNKTRYRVTAISREGQYAFSVPASRLGAFLKPVFREPVVISLKTPVTLEVVKGVRPVGKAARSKYAYTPIRRRAKRAPAASETKPPAVDEITSPLAELAAPAKKRSRKKKVAAVA